MYKFSSDLEDCVLIRSPLNDDLSLAFDQFNSTLQSMIDNHAPSFVGLLLFALMRRGLRIKLKLQREREENCYLFDVYVPLTCISSPLTWKTVC